MDKPLQLFRLLLALGMLTLGMRPALDAQAAAIVTDLHGHGSIAGGAPIELLRELPAGAQVQLRPGARVVLLHLQAQTTYELAGPGVYAVGPSGIEGLQGARAAAAKSLPPAFRNVRLQPASITQASIPMRGSSVADGSLRLIAPVATWLVERPAQLRWEGRDPDAHYTVQLTDSENRILFETTTRATAAALPEQVRLEPGKLYGWLVRTKRASGEPMEVWTEFGIAADELRARIAGARPPVDAPGADRIAFALLLEALNLREAAREQWALAARLRPDIPRLRALAENF